MTLKPRHLLLGLCLTLVGASPARETGFSDRKQLPRGFAARALPALAAEENGRFCLEAAGRRFEFGEGQMAVSAGDSSWNYRFHGVKGGIGALSVSALPEQPVPGSLEYEHGQGIVERYVVQSRGVEQQFVLPGPHAGGDVLLTGSVRTDLVPAVTSSFEGIAFRRGDVTVLYYGEAKAIDAAGKTALLEERWSQGELTIVVPASFLATARFPVLIDPWIGARATVDSAVDLAQSPAVATAGSVVLGGSYAALAVWSTNATSPQSIRGRIINPRGATKLGPISAVDEGSGSGDYYTNPRVAWSGNWVVAAEGHGGGAATPTFIQVNKVDPAGAKFTGASLNAVAGLNREQDVDVACNNSGQCLIVWAWDSDNNGTTDGIKGAFYSPQTNTFNPPFDITCCTAVHTHPRVTSNGTDYYVVFQESTTAIKGVSVNTGGSEATVPPTQSGATLLNPEVSYNEQLNEYLVVWDDGSTGVYGSVLTGVTPPVPLPVVAPLFPMAQKPEATSQQRMGWEMAVRDFSGTLAAIALVRPNGTITSASFLDSVGATRNVDLAYFYHGLSIAVYEDDLGSATDHDIRAREFITPATEYADFDNNGYASGFVWRPGPNAYFYYINDLPSISTTSVQFGTTGDIPVSTDFNGDGLPDLTVFRPSTGYWYTDLDRNGTVDGFIQFGAPGDIPVPGDYDGDGRTDLAVFRPSTGYWYIVKSSSGSLTTVQFGTSGDVPVPGYYSGFFNTNIAVWRPSNGTWYVDTDNNGTVDIQAQFGTAGDIPVPGDYGPSSGAGYPDGVTDFAVFRPSTGYWYVSRNRDGVVDLTVQFGTNGDIPVGGIYDPVGAFPQSINSPFAVFRPSNGTWYVDVNNDGFVDQTRQFGTLGDIPMQQPSGQYRN